MKDNTKQETAGRYLVQHIYARNDINGNPRHADLVYSMPSGVLVAVIDEGYRGDAEVRERFADAIQTRCDLEVVPAEYRHVLKIGQTLGGK